MAVRCAFGAKADMLAPCRSRAGPSFEDLQRAGAVGVGGDDVAAQVDQRFGGGSFLRRIEPGTISTSLTLAAGFSFCAESAKAFTPSTTSGTL